MFHVFISHTSLPYISILYKKTNHTKFVIPCANDGSLKQYQDYAECNTAPVDKQRQK